MVSWLSDRGRASHAGEGAGSVIRSGGTSADVNYRYDLAVSLDAIPVPSLYPLAHTSVVPFLSLPPGLLRQRARASLDVKGMFGLALHPENSSTSLVELDSTSSQKTLHKCVSHSGT